MKHALEIKYTTPSGEECLMGYLRCDTAEARAESLKSLELEDVQKFLSVDEQTAIRAALQEGATESALILLDETNYPLPVVLPRDLTEFAAAAGSDLVELDGDQNESPMCDGGPSRKETLKHARAAFRTIESLPSILDNILERLTTLETARPETAPATAPATETPAAETAPAEPPATETVEDTPPANVTVESPLNTETTEDPQTPEAQTPTETQPENDDQDEDMTDEMRLQLRRLAQSGRPGPASL